MTISAKSESTPGPFSADELHAAVGNNLNYYLAKWALDQESSRAYSWNWAAFFFAYYWLAYRRMYGELLAYAVLSLMVVALLLAIAFASDAGLATPIPAPWSTIGFALVISYGVCVFASFGLFGNCLYLRKVRRTIATARRHSSSPKLQIERISRQGGTSPLAVGLLLALNAARRVMDMIGS